jgi:hypothetical protein
MSQSTQNDTLFKQDPVVIPFSKPLTSTFACITSRVEDILGEYGFFPTADFVVCLHPFRGRIKQKDSGRGYAEN